MRALLAFVLFLIMLPAQASINWSGLWRNPDQQGEALLQRGDAAAAAKVYKDVRRKAYAELKAGDYAAAARDLAAFDDTDANYNRGNALAYAGDLQGAINAYDAALKRDPHNQDAIHNRELVENALKQQPPKQQNANSDQSKDGKSGGQNGSGRNASSQDQGKQDDQSGKAGKNGQPGQSPLNNQEQSGQGGNKAGQGQNSSGPGNSQQQGSAGDKSKEGKQAGQGTGGNSGQQGQAFANNQAQPGQEGGKSGNSQNSAAQGTSGNPSMQQGEQSGKGEAGRQAAQLAQGRDDAEQARRDAAASLEYAASDRQGSRDGGDQAFGNEVGGKGGRQSTPISEQQLAQEQWLHSIPDDPGGLLRRKFMIEHMMRQQKAQP